MIVTQEFKYKLVLYTTYLTCLGVVLWQGVQCFAKFFSNPQGTRLSVVKSKGQNFPSTTICSLHLKNKPFNEEFIKNCGIKSVSKYKYYNFSNPNHPDEKCRDPKKFVEEAMLKPKDFISQVSVTFFSTTGRDVEELWPKNSSLWWPNDHRHYGR